ncbi:MAG TPA: KH domain-containing protein [Candidatus Binatia bacterium]|nr:KH domain-containing protein [Candidatus Binatia bacterium]
MKELVEYIAKSIVDHPDRVNVNVVDDASTLVLELTVADTDMGRVIGKGGRVVNAMRTLVDVAAERQNKRATLEIVD